MLAPDDRVLLLDALRPPPGHTLDHAVATTFTLDLSTALTVPLAFVGFRLDDQPDPIEVMEALRRMSERLDIFCQAGAINAGQWPSDLLALLENVIHDVRRPRPGHIFHPKFWVLRFRDQSDEPFFRLLVLSRNLTADRSWDTMLWLDGQLSNALQATNGPVAHFLSELSRFTVTQLPHHRRVALAALAEELNRVRWELPNGVREARFHVIGMPGSRPFPVEEHFSGYRKLVVSPFVSEAAFRRFLKLKTSQRAVLVSRGEELNALTPDALEPLDVYEIDPAASLSVDDIDGEMSPALFAHLHAKLYIVERARLAHLFVGSANATDAGFGHNIELLCELVGPVRKMGVDALVGEDAPFRKMLTPYVASARKDWDETTAAGRALEGTLFDIAGGISFRTTVTRGTEGWISYVTADEEVPPIPEGVLVKIAPHNRPAETQLLAPSEPVDFEMTPRELADITPFLQLTARQTVEGREVERSAVICSQLEGAPDDRFQEIMVRQIDTPEKFLRLLLLLIGLASGGNVNFADTSDGSAGWSTGSGYGVLELLARALSERPESIDHLEEIVEHLRRSPSGRAVLPPGWDDVWVPALEARRAMLEDDS